MACCAGGEHECSQARADDCCAAGEQRQHGEMYGIAAQALIAPPAGVGIPVIPAIADLSRPSHLSRSDRPLGSPPDTHLLLSVFLI